MRGKILSEIQRLAGENGGQPPGARLFAQHTGLREHTWRGVYWARWSDALTDAGFIPNKPPERYEENLLLDRLVKFCRERRKFPTAMELRLYGRSHSDFPNQKSYQRHFGTMANLHRRLFEFARADDKYSDVASILVGQAPSFEGMSKPASDGFVYLIQWGANYTIGRGDQLERRVKQVRTGLPDSGKLVHAIRTDDPPGIEAYWHRRFADKRAENGEWFKLTRTDVAAFKRRKFQ